MRVLRGELPDVRAAPLVAPAHRRAPRDRPAESLRRESAPRAGARTRLSLPWGADLRRGRALLDELSRGNQYGRTDPRPARVAGAAGEFAARRFTGLKNTLRPVLTLADTVHRVFGPRTMTAAAKGLHALGLPQWLPSMPRAYRMPETLRTASAPEPDKVVYFPSCINQTMGLARDPQSRNRWPKRWSRCSARRVTRLSFPRTWNVSAATQSGKARAWPTSPTARPPSWKRRWPVLCDQSPCLYRMREKIGRMKLYEPAEFIWTFLRDRLEFRPCRRACHLLDAPHGAVRGDRFAGAAVCRRGGGARGGCGFTHPEVNAWAPRKLRPVIKRSGVKAGYSNNRTCEIGLSARSGVLYVSIVYMVDACTTQKAPPGA